jgi:hypothetical protein
MILLQILDEGSLTDSQGRKGNLFTKIYLLFGLISRKSISRFHLLASFITLI